MEPMLQVSECFCQLFVANILFLDAVSLGCCVDFGDCLVELP